MRFREQDSYYGELDLGFLFQGFIFGASAYDNELRYTFNRSGFFLETNFEYARNVAPNLSFGIWAKGTWMKFRGNGTGDWSMNGTEVEGGGFRALFSPWYYWIDVDQVRGADSDTARGMVTRFDYAGGLTAVFTF